MADNITKEDMILSYENALNSLKSSLSSTDTTAKIKLMNSYYNWVFLQTQLVQNEKAFKIPASALPNTFSKAAHDWLRPDKQALFDKYYRYDFSTGKFIINIRKENIPYNDIDLLMHSMVLTRKSVLWVEFGVNVGAEFGGRHPALVLKNMDDSFIVIPLSSQKPKTDKFSVRIDSVFGFPTLTRWANVSRIREIDISRIDFTQKIGNVNSGVMKLISDKMHSCGII